MAYGAPIVVVPAAAQGVVPAADAGAAAAAAQPQDTAGAPGQVDPSSPGTPQPDADVSGDIIVTAQNRAQRIQDVPIAINVIGSEALRDNGVTDFNSLARVAPALQITNDTTFTRVAIRGVGTNSNDEVQDQSIAINIDGEYISRATVLNAAQFDLDRVEVLRGPQGTLYGRNSTGGAINFITRKPGDRFSVEGSASYGNYDQYIVEGGVDLPFGFGGLRLSGIYNDNDGYTYHPNVNARSGATRTAAGRATLRLKPVDNLIIDVAGEYGTTRVITPAQAFVNLNLPGNGPGATCALNGYIEIAPLTPGVQCYPQNTNFLSQVDRHRYNAPATGVGYARRETVAVRGRAAYDFGPATLTYTGGYRDTDADPGRTTLSPAFTTFSYGNSVATQSHELRLNGETPGGFVWQTGGFLFRERQENAGQGLYTSALGPNGGFITYFRRPFVKIRNWAAFGQVDVPLADRLTAVAGLRYTKDNRSAIYEQLGFRFNSGPGRIDAPATAAQTFNLKTDADKITWLAGLNFKLDRDTLLYAKVATGFKAGGFDAVGTYDPETNTAYEAGAKFSFGSGGRNTFNLASFYYDYKNLQASVLIDSALGQQIFNAGKATIWGVEAEMSVALDDNNRFNASFNYLNARYDRLLASYPVFCVGCAATGVGDLDTNPATVTQPNLSGNVPPQSPKFIVTTGYDHDFDFEFGVVTASVFSRFKSAYFLDIFNGRDSTQKSFTQTDLNLKYQPLDKKWNVQAFVQNIEDIRPLAYAGFTAAGNDDIYNWQFGAPRTYGVRVGVNF
ncbi:MAG TPA: TonB-dependent receptor [Sphingomonas sp.]|uniref:TonB-dependent receptor n=1 Tax=Sphingomonas sp. TaxID=28214 RepID=UPI002ED81CE0